MKKQAISRAVSVALAGVLALGVSTAFAQASGSMSPGGMSDTEKASGTMSNMDNTGKSHKMTKHHTKKGTGGASMSHEASGAMAPQQ